MLFGIGFKLVSAAVVIATEALDPSVHQRRRTAAYHRRHHRPAGARENAVLLDIMPASEWAELEANARAHVD